MNTFNETKQLNRVVLQGFGGIGKSQLAIEYATRHQGDYTAIFWCNGKSETLLRLEVAAIAELIPLNDVLGSNGKILKDETGLEKALTAVFDWLFEPSNKQWLLIVDNVETHPATNGGTEAPYEIWEQSPRHGSMLITIRLASLRRLGKGIEVKEVSAEDGIQILSNATGSSTTDQEVAIVVQRLQGQPLAIAQVGAYIHKTDITPKDYLDSYEAKTREILRQNNDIAYVNGPIMATLQISFDAVERRNPSASKFLSLLGFLDNSDIWWGLFHLAWKSPNSIAESEISLLIFRDTDYERSRKWLTDLAKDEVLFNQIVSTLYEFHLVRRNEARDSISIHPVIHDWLRQHASPEVWRSNMKAVATILGRAATFARFEESWVPQRRLAFHVENFSDLLRTGHLKKAEVLNRRTSEGRERLDSFDHWKARQKFYNVGLAHQKLGKYKEAESLWKKLLDATIRIEGTPLTQGATRLLDDLGRLFTITKRYDEAEKYFVRALVERKSQFERGSVPAAPGEAIPLNLELQVGNTCGHFGILKQAQGKIEAAESLYRRSLNIFENQLGPHHTRTLLVTADLGNVNFERGDLERAETYLRTALTNMEEHLGEHHHYTVKLYQDMAELLMATNRKEDALTLLEKAGKDLDLCMSEGRARASYKKENIMAVDENN